MIESPAVILGILSGLVAASIATERASPRLARFGAATWVIVLGAIASNAGLLPTASPTYDGLFTTVAPLAVILLLFRASLGELRLAGPTLLLAFALAVAATVGGVLAATLLLGAWLPATPWKLAGMFTGTYVGGSANFVALQDAWRIPTDVFAGANAADALVTALWMTVTLAAPGFLSRRDPDAEDRRTGRATSPPPPLGAVLGGRRSTGSGDVRESDPAGLESGRFDPLAIAAIVALALGVLVVSRWFESRWPAVPSAIVYTTLALVLAQLGPVRRLRGSGEVGLLLVYLFLAAIGAACDVAKMLEFGLAIFAYASVLVAVHGVLLLLASRGFRIHVEIAAIASQSCIGGSTTALALAKSFGRDAYLLPGIVVGTLGNALGTYLGFAVAALVRGFGS